jgi:hypothetical protein
MAIDEQNKGIPIAQILFTAKKDTKAVHADYDKQLLDQQLGLWKQGMGTNDSGEGFAPIVGTTDNDTRERYALQKHWDNILLLLCMFHVWQCWRNGLNKHLRIVPKENRARIRSRLARFLMRLLKEIDKYEEAVAAYNQELAHFTTLTKSKDIVESKQGKGGIAFLTYLQSYLKVEDFWRSWSVAGAIEAAARMNVPLSQVARTTNHLESFNGRIKNKYFAPYLHSGRLPRIDVWVHTLITEALPTFFAEWAERRELKGYFNFMRHAAASNLQPPEQKSSVPQLPTDGNLVILKTFPTRALVIASAKSWEAEVFSNAAIKRARLREGTDDEHEDAMDVLEPSMMMAMNDSDYESSGDEGSGDEEVEVGRGWEGAVESSKIIMDGTTSVTVDPNLNCRVDMENGRLVNELGALSLIEDHMSVEPPSYHYSYSLYSPGARDTPNYTVADMALNESAILEDLSLELLSVQPQSLSPDNGAGSFDFLRSNPGQPDADIIACASSHSNQQGTAMLDVLKAEDTLCKAIREALDAGIPMKSLEPNISSSIRERILGQIPKPLEAHKAHPRRSSVSPAIGLPALDDVNKLKVRLLAGFEVQKKSKRHVSYGLR